MVIPSGKSSRFLLLKQLWKNAPVILFTLFFFSCENSDEAVKDMNSQNLGIEEVNIVDINYTLAGKAKAKLLSPKMLRVQDMKPYVEFPNKLHVDFYDETGAIDSRLDALYGKYYDQESRVFLKDSVRVINVKGDTLYCNELWWDRSRIGFEFYTDKAVRIRRKLQIIDGVGMEARQDFKEWVIKNVTNSFIRVPNSQFPTD